MSVATGPKRLFEDVETGVVNTGKKRSRVSLGQPVGPLQGVVICLTGMASDRKKQLHQLVEKLGGRYTRDFSLDQNTHLAAETKHGPKYELATSHPNIHIVSPTWIEECEKSGSRVNEFDYPVVEERSSIPLSTDRSTYRHVCESLLKGNPPSRSLFEFYQFYMLGFEDVPDIKNVLGKVIRRAGGTIHWEFSDDVNILIIHDICHESLRKAARLISTQHPNLPPSVSPRWVVDSFRKNDLVPYAKYPPLRIQCFESEAQKISTKTTVARSGSSTVASVFRGLLFAMARIAPPEGGLDFDSKSQETLVRAHGGQMLTMKLADAIRADAKNGGQRRKCFVVCWGGPPQLDLNPILSQVRRNNACDLVLVAPVWLRTCVRLQKVISPSLMSGVLEPQSWPLRRLDAANFRVSVTGFQATEKVALVELMKMCGIDFLNEMSTMTTHLVCKTRATGVKMEKAVEWGLHIVSVEWLFHILQFGYGSEDDSKQSSDLKFSLVSHKT